MARKSTKRRPRLNRRDDSAYQVSVSHATADKWVATMLCERIEAAGARTFRDDRDIGGGDSIPDSIRREIVQSREMIVLLTPESIERPWVILEIGMAMGRRRGYRITPVLYHAGTECLPSLIEAKKAVNLNEVDRLIAEIASRARGSRR